MGPLRATVTTSRRKCERLKREYRLLFGELARVRARRDPTGLVGMGVPDDEYEPEAGTILPRLGTVSSEGEALDVVHKEFVGSVPRRWRARRRHMRRPLPRFGESGEAANGGKDPLDEAQGSLLATPPPGRGVGWDRG